MLHYLVGKYQLDEVIPSETPAISSWDRYADRWLRYGGRILQLRRRQRAGGKRRSLTPTYAQSMLILAGATTLDRARVTAVAMAAEAEIYDQLIPSIDLSHISGGRGHSDFLYALEMQEIYWAPEERIWNADGPEDVWYGKVS